MTTSPLQEQTHAMTDETLDRLRRSPVVGRYFEADGSLVVVAGGAGEGEGGGDGGGEGGGSGSEGGDDGGSGAASGGSEEGGDGDEGGDEKVTMTQAEIDRMIDKRLGRAKSKWESELKTYADAQNQTETERLQAEKEASDQAAEQARQEALATKVEVAAERLALKADVDPDRISRFVEIAKIGDNVEDLVDDGKPDEKAVQKLIDTTLKDWPEFKKAAKGGNGRSGGSFNGGSGQSEPATLEDAVSAHYS